jgi:hypothetical protein
MKYGLWNELSVVSCQSRRAHAHAHAVATASRVDNSTLTVTVVMIALALTILLQTPTSDSAVVFNSSVVYNSSSSPTVDFNCHGDRLTFQTDGNLLLVTPRGPKTFVWDSQTYATTSPARTQGTTLTLADDGPVNQKKKRRKCVLLTPLPCCRQYYHQACEWFHCMASDFRSDAWFKPRTISRRGWQ